MKSKVPFSRDVLEIDAAREVGAICGAIRDALGKRLHKRGLVVGISGGIDSSVTAALCTMAAGKEKVIGLQMPERNSAPETRALSSSIADHLGIAKIEVDITPILEAVDYYEKYDAAVRMAVPEYGRGWRSKIAVSDLAEDRGYTLFSIVAAPPGGAEAKKRLDLESYLAIVAATNFKQRIRKMLEYYHADLRNYAVAGTPNRLEYDQGFFVKLGDGAADIKPIAHLYKTQVLQLARHLGLPVAIIDRVPTTDTYSLPQGQDEFYFAVPYDVMDLCLYGKNHGVSPGKVGRVAGLPETRVIAIYQDIDRKRAATRYLHLAPLLAGPVPEIDGEPAGRGSWRT